MPQAYLSYRDTNKDENAHRYATKEGERGERQRERERQRLIVRHRETERERETERARERDYQRIL